MKTMAPLHPLFLGAMLVATLPALSGADTTATAPANRPDPWQPLRRLIGTWEGESQGESGAGHSAREYRFVLGDRFIEATNVSTYPPQEKNPKGERHEDRGFFSYDRAQKKIVLRQFHLEGFVNQYALESISPDGNTVVFVTTAIENIPPGWRARETYTFLSDDEFTEKFELAEPDKDFAPYSEARFKRKR
jgi:THAP4-like, heme-binding beta-barrel domain